MEVTKPQYVKARFNHDTRQTEIVYVEAGVEKVLNLTEEMTNEMIDTIPLFDEQKEIKKIMKTIYDGMHERMLSALEIDKAIDRIQKDHEDARNRLAGAKTKIDVAKWSAIVHSLASEKATLDTRRHLIKLMELEESRLWAKLLEIQHGSKS
jgi:hypothetical protein